MGFDYTSGMTKGKCTRCEVVWYWPSGKLRLRQARCPTCNGRLHATTHIMKRYPWRKMPGLHGK